MTQEVYIIGYYEVSCGLSLNIKIRDLESVHFTEIDYVSAAHCSSQR